MHLASQKGGVDISLADCRLIELPRVADDRGNLTFIEPGAGIDFDIARIYYLYDVPGGANRGGHAHRTLKQLIIAVSGSFDVILDDSTERQRVHLNRSYNGLYLPQMIWREIDNFSGGSVCLVLASDIFKESDYIREYEVYLSELTKAGN